MYPKGWWLPDNTAVFGNVRMDHSGGDPLTPGLPSIPGATYASSSGDGSSWREVLPSIPVQTVGWRDAHELLRNLNGSLLPSQWLPSLATRTGPSATL